MQKTGIVLLLLLFCLLAKSQDSTDFTLNNIKRYTTGIAASVPMISSQLQAGKHGKMEQQAAYMKRCADSVEEEMEYLPDEYYYRLNTLVNAYHTNINAFAALTQKQEFLGKGKLLETTIAALQQRQNSLNTLLDAAYEKAVQQQNESNSATADGMPIATDNSSVVMIEAGEPGKTTTSGNPVLLAAIHEAQQQITQCMDSIQLALNSNDFNAMGIHAKGIFNASLKISDLALLLKTDQKESLYILATGLKNLSEALRQLTYKGIAAHDDIQEYIDKMAIKFSSLTTGISLVQ